MLTCLVMIYIFGLCRDCSVNISDFRTGQRHDMWLPLNNIKTGRLHIAVTVVEKVLFLHL